MLFNIYAQFDGAPVFIRDKTIDKVEFWTRAILTGGGEITSIIDVEKD